MLYLISISALIVLLLVTVSIGRRITMLLPTDIKISIGFYISPLLGLAVMIPAVTLYGWLFPFKTAFSLSLSVLLLIIGIIFEKHRMNLFRDWVIISVFAVIVTIPLFAPLIRFNSYNPFNDIFTYIVHGQWLQEHSFSNIISPSGYFPAETQIALYQTSNLRMGSSFFLGYVQSLFHLKWSYYAYLCTVGLPFVLGSLAIGGIIRQVIPVSKVVGISLCTLPAFTMNGFIYGAQGGFFPQTFGLAFAAGLACLIPALTNNVLNAWSRWSRMFLYLIPLALCCGSFVLTYNDMLLSVFAGTFLFLCIICIIYWNTKYKILTTFLILSIQVFIIVNFEGIRVFKNHFYTIADAASGAVKIGWPVLWIPTQFVAHSFGLRMPFNHDVYALDKLISIWIFPLILIFIIIVIFKIFQNKPRNLTIIFILCINFAYWLAFIKFRYLTTGLECEIGNTFLQFKLAKWLAPFNIALLGICLSWLYTKKTKYKCLFTYAFLALFLCGITIHYQVIAKMFTQQFQDETMRKYSSFNLFLDLQKRIANIPKDQVIYLGIPFEHHKLTQMVMYILSDHRLTGKYEDGYIVVPEYERDIPIENADWIIQWKPIPEFVENLGNQIGPFIIRKTPYSFFQMESMNGAYPTESDSKGSRNWVRDSVEYRFRNVGNNPKGMLQFEFRSNQGPRTLFLELYSAKDRQILSLKIPMKDNWVLYKSPMLNTPSDDIIVRLTADGEAIDLSSTDTRRAKFIVQNISMEKADERIKP